MTGPLSCEDLEMLITLLTNLINNSKTRAKKENGPCVGLLDFGPDVENVLARGGLIERRAK
jgi:hypothetical protein